MMLYRSLVLGLLGALLLLQVEGRRSAPAPAAPVGAAADAAPTIVDVSRSALAAAGLTIEDVVGVRPGERLVSADGSRGPVGADGYVDFELARGAQQRRVVVLVHR